MENKKNSRFQKSIQYAKEIHIQDVLPIYRELMNDNETCEK